MSFFKNTVYKLKIFFGVYPSHFVFFFHIDFVSFPLHFQPIFLSLIWDTVVE